MNVALEYPSASGPRRSSVSVPKTRKIPLDRRRIPINGRGLGVSFSQKSATIIGIRFREKTQRCLVKIDSHKYVPLASNDGARRGRVFVHILEELLDSRKGRLLDLGCGPCLFAQKAQASGFQVTAVDARSDRVPSPDALGSITFIQKDVRLLYHLELNDQLALMRNCRGSVVVIDTQFCEEGRAPFDASSRQTTFVQEQGYCGVLFPEANNVMAGWGNDSSFWHTERSLLRMLEACGFERVTKVVPQYSSQYGPRGFFLLDLP